ncbi:small ubiquitin-related modifier 3 isoform X2 [Camelus ferus]|uniref:Small ubiquitin-related modifier 3 isoform X2 n=1 Tax=Camelus ferus TaxID=419612 RepID=A0A8B8U031_CAMFR|nr:small ubiquitin-related modifier 3 isoform X2 [Camelus ferus]
MKGTKPLDLAEMEAGSDQNFQWRLCQPVTHQLHFRNTLTIEETSGGTPAWRLELRNLGRPGAAPMPRERASCARTRHVTRGSQPARGDLGAKRGPASSCGGRAAGRERESPARRCLLPRRPPRAAMSEEKPKKSKCILSPHGS